MLPKGKRLNLKTSFKWVASGNHVSTPNLKLMFKLSGNPEPLVGIALSKGNFKKAHDRNRAKRLTSKAVELIYPRLRKGINLVIIPEPGALNQSPEVLKNELEGIKDICSPN